MPIFRGFLEPLKTAGKSAASSTRISACCDGSIKGLPALCVVVSLAILAPEPLGLLRDRAEFDHRPARWQPSPQTRPCHQHDGRRFPPNRCCPAHLLAATVRLLAGRPRLRAAIPEAPPQQPRRLDRA